MEGKSICEDDEELEDQSANYLSLIIPRVCETYVDKNRQGEIKDKLKIGYTNQSLVYNLRDLHLESSGFGFSVTTT